MTLGEIRAELLAQHDELRAGVERVRVVLARLERGEVERDELHRAILHLGDALRTHTQREEELVRDVLPHVDAWGKVRHEFMLEEHVAEHAQLYEALMQTSKRGDHASAAAETFLTELLGHMAREEKIFLAAEVLSDDGPPPDSFGG